MSVTQLYTSECIGSGQSGICAKCLRGPTADGHDGCLGELPWPVMNACCGHGDDRQAYIQYSNGDAVVRGAAAVSAQRAMVAAQQPQGGEDE